MKWSLIILGDVKNLFYGILLGVSNIIPGVSAGTVAVILRIYNTLINSISGILKNFKVNFRFLFFIGIGVLIGIIGLSNIMDNLLGKYPWQMSYLFMGLIAGSIGILFKEAMSFKSKKIHFVYFLITFLILVGMKFINPSTDVVIISELNLKTILILVLSGFLASSSMILPGISGSFVLVLLGIYNSIISAVSHFQIKILIPFGVGVVLGFVVMVKLIEYMLKKFKVQSYMAILGLVVGSIVSIFPGFEFSSIGISCIITFIFGFLISLFLCRFNSKN